MPAFAKDQRLGHDKDLINLKALFQARQHNTTKNPPRDAENGENSPMTPDYNTIPDKFQSSDRPNEDELRNKSDDELLDIIRRHEASTDEVTLRSHMTDANSAEEISKMLLEDLPDAEEQDAHALESIWLCITILWERWMADKPSYEMIDDRMQEGYDYYCGQNTDRDIFRCADIWIDTWSDIRDTMDRNRYETISEFDPDFGGCQMVFNWVNDLMLALLEAGEKQSDYLRRRLSIGRQILDRTGDDYLNRKQLLANIAESHAKVGQTDKADAMFRDLIAENPKWAEGWTRWAHSYISFQDDTSDYQKALRILQQGYEAEEVEDRPILLQGLADVYEDLGQEEKAREMREERRQIADHWERKRQRQEPEISKVNHESLPAENTASGLDIPAEEYDDVGRNDPCPCGSGLKYKKCCWEPGK